jgi:hypothetical protein
MAKRRVRIRSKRLDQVAEDRLALAVWLIARDIVEDRTDTKLDIPVEGDDHDDGSEEAV